MELKELRAKSVSELHQLLAELREKLRDINFNITAKQLKNIASHKAVKKDIARVLTVMREMRK